MGKLKCWKKRVEHEGYTEWINKDEFRWVGVNKLTSSQIRDPKKTWHTGGNRINEVDFETKDKALKYAKKYMKEHDKC